MGQIIHYSIYVEGLPECSIEFDREEPKRRTRRPVIEAAICCDPVSGMLDIVSKGGRPLREEIAQTFAARLLDSENALSPARPRDFDLDRLKLPMPFPTDPSDGIKSVEVTLLRLRDAAGHFGRVTIEVDGEHPDICSTSAGWFARLAGLGRTSIYSALGSGELKSLKIGKRRLIAVEALRTWLLSHEVAP